MEYRKLGRTGLLVSRAFFGGTGIGEFESEQSTQRLVDAAWDRGINTFYSANVIGSTIPGVTASTTTAPLNGNLGNTMNLLLGETEQRAAHPQRFLRARFAAMRMRNALSLMKPPASRWS